MAYFIDVFRIDNPPLQRRQSPLIIDDNLMMVMDLTDLDLFGENLLPDGPELHEFMHKIMLFADEEELYNVFQVNIREIMVILNETIPCVGCRRSVERLYKQIIEIGGLALDPLVASPQGFLMIRRSAIASPRLLCSLISDSSDRLSYLVDSQPRSKKSRRCLLHSWDLQKSRPVTPAWKELWDIMADKCKAEVLLIDFNLLLSKLETYLKKHRFCGECRTKVMKAYNLLVDEGDTSKEKGFVPALYNKIKKCSPGKHIHLQAETKYIESLIARAEPELMGNRRERHAKTMEIAQEEVLTCVGICIYDRLHRIFLRLKEEEFTCKILAAAAISAMCRTFETIVEEKLGVSRLELLYREITKQDRVLRQRKEMKKLKKKRKKNNGKRSNTSEDVNIDESHNNNDCEKNSDCYDNLDNCECELQDKEEICGCEVNEEDSTPEVDCRACDTRWARVSTDNGYVSAENPITISSSTGSQSSDGSDVACSEGLCDDEGDCLLEHKLNTKSTSTLIIPLTLEEMLKTSKSEEEEELDDFIPAEEIRAFQAKNRQIGELRTELREKLRNQFQELLTRTQAAHS